MSEKKSAWKGLAFLALFFLVIEQLAAIYVNISGNVKYAWFFTGMLASPALCFWLGRQFDRKKNDLKNVIYHVCALIAALLLYLFIRLIFKMGFSASLLGGEKALILLALFIFFSIAEFALRRMPAWLSAVLALLILIIGFIPSLPVKAEIAAYCFFFFTAGVICPDEIKLIKSRGCHIISAVVLLAFLIASFTAYKTLRILGRYGLREYFGRPDAGAGSQIITGLLTAFMVLFMIFCMLSIGDVLGSVFYAQGERYISALFAVIIMRQLVYQGWWTGILKNMNGAHWKLIYMLAAVLMAFAALSFCMEVFTNVLLWPVGKYAGQKKRLAGFFMNMKKYRFLLRELIKKGIVLKYRRSFFGILWSLFEPLLTMIVLTFVFSNFFGHNDPFYSVFILTGRLMFSLFQSTTTQAMKSVRANASMIKKVYVPKYMYPLSSILFNFVLFVISLIDLVLVMIYFKVPFTGYTAFAIVPILNLLLFSVGIGMILATVNVFFRDIEYLWNVFCLLLMYCSAIFYKPANLMGTSAEWILRANPVYQTIYNFRRVIIDGVGLDMASLGYTLLISLVSLFVGFVIFYKKQDEFILHI